MNFFSLEKVKFKVINKDTRTPLFGMGFNDAVDYFEQMFTHWVHVNCKLCQQIVMKIKWKSMYCSKNAV